MSLKFPARIADESVGRQLAMLSNLLENPKLFRHLVQDLPVGIYIVDQDRRIRFWNRGVERITGYLSHEVVGHVLQDAVQICDRRGNQLFGEYCPVTMTLNLRNSGSAELNQSGKELLTLLAEQLKTVPNHLSIEGHTDSKPFASKGNCGNWELSSDRANAARRLMQQSGLRADQVTQVRGFADQRLRNLKDSSDPANRRASIIVECMTVDITAAGTQVEGEKEPGESKSSVGGNSGPGDGIKKE